MKKTLKRAAALLLSTALAVSMAGCTASSSTATSSGTSGEGAASTGTKEPPKKMRYVSPGNEWAEQDRVLEEVNKKLQADGLNIEVELIRIPWDAWDQKVNLMLSTGEEFELLHVMQDKKPLNILRAQNAIQPLNDYLDEYPLLKELSESRTEYTSNGEVLGIAGRGNYYVSRDYGRIFYRQDIFEKAGGEVPTTVDGVLELAKEMQDILLEETGEKCYTWTHELSRPMTWLHRSYEEAPFIVDNTLGIAKCNIDGTVESFYESDIFKRDCETYRKMYQMGLVNPDILTSTSNDRTDINNYGKFIFGFETFDYQTEAAMMLNTGTQLGDFWLNDELGNVQYFGGYNSNAVPTSCKDPNVPLSFLNWLYSDEENYRLFMYGIEGVTYNITDDGMVEEIYGADGNKLYRYDDWQIAHEDFRIYGADCSEKYLELAQNPVEGRNVFMPTVGFNFDTTNVVNEMANLQNEIITSIYPIKFGVVDYESNIDQAIERLKAAGLDKVLEEYAKQYKAHYEDVKDKVGVTEG